ncbi:MAG: single-stranded DNA-binding protein [bacterium]
MSTNKVFLTGNLGSDIDVQESRGTTFAHLSVASNYRVRVDDDTYEQRTTWTRVTAFNGLANSLAILGKGSKVFVQGHLRTNTFEKDGVKFRHSEVIADEIEFLDVREPGQGADEADEADEPAA